MGDAIKRFFHKRYRSTDKDFKPLQSFPYRDAVPGTPPRRGSVPLRGNCSIPIDGPFNTPAYNASANRAQRSASLGSAYGRPRPNRLRKAVSDASRRGRPGNISVDRHGGRLWQGDMPPVASPPLPGTAVTSDDARFWRDVERTISPSVRQLSVGGESRYGEDVADRVLAENFPSPPPGPAVKQNDDIAECASDFPAPLSVPSKTGVSQERGSYTLTDGEGFPSLDREVSSNTQSRLFLQDSDEESGDASSRERGHRDSPSSLKRKKGHSSGLRNFSSPTNDYSVQEPVETYRTPDGFSNGYHESAPSRSYLIEDSPEPIDQRDSEDISYHSRYAPAVTHNTIYTEVRHIREEQIFREIHTHDVFHRVLPIVDVEVLPARHFVPAEDGGLREIPEAEIPGRTLDNQATNWLIAELVSRGPRDDETPIAPRHFTARAFPGAEGDERRYTTAEGFERVETTWVHPPTIETGARESGQTEPLYMLSPGPNSPMDEGHEIEKYEPSPQRSTKDLTGGIRDRPFDECAEFEARGEEAGVEESG